MSARGPRRAQLTADQAGRVERARADLDDTRTADNPVDYPIYVGRLRHRLDDLLALIGELTGGAS